MDVIVSFFTENFWATCVVLASLVISLTAFINSKFKVNGIWKQVISWVVSLVLTVGTYFLGLVNMAEPAWLSIILTGLVVGLSSNGVYDVTFIKSFVNKIFGTLTNIPKEIEDNK